MPCPKGTELRCEECLLSNPTKRNESAALDSRHSVPRLNEEPTSSSKLTLVSSDTISPAVGDCNVSSTARPGTAITNATAGTSSSSGIDSVGEDDISVTSATEVLSSHGKVPIELPSHNRQPLRNPWSSTTAEGESFKSHSNKRKASSTIPLASFSAFSSSATTAFSSPKKMCSTFPPAEDHLSRTAMYEKTKSPEEVIQHLQEENEQLKLQVSYLEHIPDIVLAFDEDGMLHFVSPSISNFVDYTSMELLGTCFWNLLCHDSATVLIHSANKALQDRPVRCKKIRISKYVLELNLKDRDGTLRPMALNGVVSFQERTAEYICSISHRESPKTKAEAELARYRWIVDLEEDAATLLSGNGHSLIQRTKHHPTDESPIGQENQQDEIIESSACNSRHDLKLEMNATEPHPNQIPQNVPHGNLREERFEVERHEAKSVKSHENNKEGVSKDEAEEWSATNQLGEQTLLQASNLNGHEQTQENTIIATPQAIETNKNHVVTEEKAKVETSLMLDVVNAH